MLNQDGSRRVPTHTGDILTKAQTVKMSNVLRCFSAFNKGKASQRKSFFPRKSSHHSGDQGRNSLTLSEGGDAGRSSLSSLTLDEESSEEEEVKQHRIAPTSDAPR